MGSWITDFVHIFGAIPKLWFFKGSLGTRLRSCSSEALEATFQLILKSALLGSWDPGSGQKVSPFD